MRTIKFLSSLLTTMVTNVKTILKSGYTPVLNRLRAFLFLGFIIFSLASCSTKNDPTLIEDPAGNTDPDGNTNSGGNNNPGGNNSTNPGTKGPDIVQIEAGNRHALVLLSDNTLWGAGNNDLGQLGLPRFDYGYNNHTTLKKIAENVRFVKATDDETLIIKTDDTLWGCGYNFFSILGTGDDRQVNTFIKVADNVRSIGAVESALVIVKKDNTVWAIGKNDGHALSDEGMGDSRDYKLSPIKIADDVKEAYVGIGRTFVLKNDNTLWGRGYSIGLGIGRWSGEVGWTRVTDDVKKCKADGDNVSAIIKSDNSLWLAGTNVYNEFGVPYTKRSEDWHLEFVKVFDNVKDVDFGGAGITILSNDKTLWASGKMVFPGDVESESYMKIGDDVLMVSRGGNFLWVLKSDKTLLSIGRNPYGQLGTGGYDGTTDSFKEVHLPWKN